MLSLLIKSDFPDLNKNYIDQCESFPTAEPRHPFRKPKSAPVSAPSTCVSATRRTHFLLDHGWVPTP
jgi:hypothetical protein